MKENAHKVDWSLIAKYLADECTEVEENHLKHWMRRDVRNQRFVSEARRVWEASESTSLPSLSAEEEENDWSALEASLNGGSVSTEGLERARTDRRAQPAPAQPVGGGSDQEGADNSVIGTLHTFTRRFSFRNGLALAACITVLASAIVFFYGDTVHNQGEERIGQVTTDRGERATITLPDGSTVRLNVDSSIRADINEGSDYREVYIDGEAFFDVRYDPSRPFIVHTETAAVRVVGTSFNVYSYEDDEDVVVAVADGEVNVVPSIGNLAPLTGLRSGEVVHLSKQLQTATRQQSDLEKHLAWQDGRIVLDDEPLSRVASRLERWYKINVEVDPDIADKQITANLRSTSLEEVLRIISTTLGIEYSLYGDDLQFSESE